MLKQFNILVLALVTVLALGLPAQADGQSDLAARIYDLSRFSAEESPDDFLRVFRVPELQALGFDLDHPIGVFLYPMELDGCALLLWNNGKAQGRATLIDLERVTVPSPAIFGGPPSSAAFEMPPMRDSAIIPKDGAMISASRSFDAEGRLLDDGTDFAVFPLFRRGSGILAERTYRLIHALHLYKTTYCSPLS